MLAPPSTGLAGQISLTFPSRRRAPPRRDGSRDLDEKNPAVAKLISKSSFRARPGSRRRAREARNHAELVEERLGHFGASAAAPCALRASTAEITRSRRK